jgi:hypothetical protein
MASQKKEPSASSSWQKQNDPRLLIVRGISIDWTDEYQNEKDSIRINGESGSNMIDWIDEELVQNVRLNLESNGESG